MNRTHTLPRLTFLVSAGLTCTAVVLRTAAFFTHFDADVGYFDRTILPLIDKILSLLALVAPIACAIAIPKGDLHARADGGKRALIALAPLCGFLLFICLMFTHAGWVSDKLLLFSVILAIGGAAYFLGVLLDMKDQNLLSLLGFLPVLWGITAVAHTYSDPYVTLNSPIKLSIQFGALGLMLAMTAELRCRLGKAAPRVYLALHCIGMFFCLHAAIPCLAARLFGLLPDSLYPLWATVLLGAGLYHVGRLIQFIFLKAPAIQAVMPETDKQECAAFDTQEASNETAGTPPSPGEDDSSTL